MYLFISIVIKKTDEFDYYYHDFKLFIDTFRVTL